MKQYDYEKDEIIRHKNKTKKPKTPKSDHKHQYLEKYVDDGFIPVTLKICSICNISKIHKYHWGTRNN